ncbi:hypothetical protein GM547_14170, partial [Streptococcus pneumoniae]|uniref:hypothetical protein n=1 Tax=Streptococcus pneumoniae TaxID=1313 RepID=UPI0012D82692
MPGADFEAAVQEITGGYLLKVYGYDPTPELVIDDDKIPAWAQHALKTALSRMGGCGDDGVTYAFTSKAAVLD